jgi:hypothetical protein
MIRLCTHNSAQKQDNTAISWALLSCPVPCHMWVGRAEDNKCPHGQEIHRLNGVSELHEKNPQVWRFMREMQSVGLGHAEDKLLGGQVREVYEHAATQSVVWG